MDEKWSKNGTKKWPKNAKIAKNRIFAKIAKNA